MANTYGIIEIAQPTGLTATAKAGGELEPSTTYYYKIVAWNRIGGAYVYSPRSATVTATTTADNRTVQLDWDDGGISWGGGYSGYHILRNTSDDFSDTIDCCVGSYGTYSRTTTFDDDGSKGLDATINYKTGLPIIYAYGDTQFKMGDLYDYDVSQGWGRIKPTVDSDFMEFNTSFNDYGVGYYVNANLLIGYNSSGSSQEASFYHIAAPLITYGAFRSSTLSTVQFGSPTNNYKTANTDRRVQLITHGAHYNSSALRGVLYLYGLTVINGGKLWGGYQYSGWNNPYSGASIGGSAGSKVIDCDFFAMGNGYSVGGIFDVFLGNRFGGCRVATYDATLEKVITSSNEGIGCRHLNNAVFVEPENKYATHDVIWCGSNPAFLLNPVFDSHNQKDTDNEPYIKIAYSASNNNGCLTIATSLKLTVQDGNGNSISGATVSVVDKNGNSALFQATESYLVSDINSSSSSLNVTDSSDFEVGDYIRLKYGQEIMKVTEITDATHIAVDRGQLGSKAVVYYRNIDLIYKQVDSLETDADGIVDCGTMFKYVLLPTEDIIGVYNSGTGTPATHIANGKITKIDHTPHTVTISKPGYKTRVVKYTMDRKREEIEKLSPDGTDITNATLYGSNIY